MKIILFASLFVLSSAATLFCQNQPGFDTLAKTFTHAFNTGDTNTLKASCAAQFWNSKGDSPLKLIKQGFLKRRAFFLEATNLIVMNDRACSEMLVISAESRRVSDLVYFYARYAGGSWLFGGMNEDRNFRDKFMAGLIDEQFNPGALPASEKLALLAQRIVKLSPGLNSELSVENFTALFQELFTLADGAAERYSPYLYFNEIDPAVTETHWSETLGRGSITFYGKKTQDNPWPDQFTLYFQQTGQGFAVYSFSSRLSAGSFLEF